MRMKEQEPLSDRQEAILRFVARHIDKHGWQPSIRDIGDHFGIASPNGVASHLRAMKRKGYVSPNPTTARAISFEWKKFL